MSNLEKKPRAVSYLKQNMSVKDTADKLGLHEALVREWKDAIPNTDFEAQVTEALIIDTKIKTISELDKIGIDSVQSKLETKLKTVALDLLERISQTKHMEDEEFAKALNLTADSISKLQNALVNKGASVNVQTNVDLSQSTVDNFRKLLRN